MEISIRAHLPAEVNGIRYVRNHHFIELTDKAGNTIRLGARTLIRLVCSSDACPIVILVDWKPGTEPTTIGVPEHCYHCGEKMVVTWVKGLAFIAEGESSFGETIASTKSEAAAPVDVPIEDG